MSTGTTGAIAPDGTLMAWRRDGAGPPVLAQLFAPDRFRARLVRFVDEEVM